MNFGPQEVQAETVSYTRYLTFYPLMTACPFVTNVDIRSKHPFGVWDDLLEQISLKIKHMSRKMTPLCLFT